MMKADLILCECNCDEHQIIIKYDDDDYWESVYISYHLQKLPIWSRLKYAIRYIFGFKSRYGAWGELILSPTDETIHKLQNVITYLNKIKDKNTK